MSDTAVHLEEALWLYHPRCATRLDRASDIVQHASRLLLPSVGDAIYPLIDYICLVAHRQEIRVTADTEFISGYRTWEFDLTTGKATELPPASL